MNRKQRRAIQFQKDRKNGLPEKNIFPPMPKVREPKPPDFSGVPLATMCQSIQLLINELYSRGFPVYDFDNKKKFVQGIQIIQGKVYFLAAEERTEDEKI